MAPIKRLLLLFVEINKLISGFTEIQKFYIKYFISKKYKNN